jgi:outer membrane lipoprotein-sorting protein
MRRFVAIVLLFAFFFDSGWASAQSSAQGKKIVEDMLLAVSKVNTLKFKLKRIERIESKMLKSEADMKYSKTLKAAYSYMQSPTKGLELLYVDGKNGNNACVNPNSFPYVTLNLDPYGSTMRKDNHHTIHEVGFGYISDIISYMIRKSGHEYDKYFSYQGEILFDNRPCYKVVIDYTSAFKYVPYTVKSGETLTSIGYANFVNDYLILEKNPDLDDYNDVKPGQVIQMPNAYAAKTVLYIDKVTYMPIFQAMYDEKGLYEQYEFLNLQVNPKIPDEEFTRDYKDYNF